LIVTQIPNIIFTSNTYKLKAGNDVWLVDAGGKEAVFSALHTKEIVRGVFLTHAHYDHIWGLNDLISLFPECVIYGSEVCLQGLYQDKLNLSFYHENPFVFSGSIIKTVSHNQYIPLADNNTIQCFYTPGHNPGCVTYSFKKYIFTGDSFIPNVPVVTKLKGGNKEANIDSLKRIMQLISPDTIVCPGHGEMVKGAFINR